MSSSMPDGFELADMAREVSDAFGFTLNDRQAGRIAVAALEAIPLVAAARRDDMGRLSELAKSMDVTQLRIAVMALAVLYAGLEDQP